MLSGLSLFMKVTKINRDKLMPATIDFYFDFSSSYSYVALPGITRLLLIEILRADGSIPIEERPCTLDELRNADEVWISSSTKEIAPVIMVDGAPVGDGEVGDPGFPLLEGGALGAVDDAGVGEHHHGDERRGEKEEELASNLDPLEHAGL